MERVWIIGSGRFGLRAARYLLRQDKRFQVVLVDSDPGKLDPAKGLDCIKVHADGIAYLDAHLNSWDLPDWIVPALPVHLAWEWCRRQLGAAMMRPVQVSSQIERQLPNPMRGPDGNIYVSHANFICPANCDEPHDVCTVTQEPRKQEMYRLLSRLRFENFSSLVIQSRQLGPGVGGYAPKALFLLLEKIKAVNGPFLLSTACRCHGVITGGGLEGETFLGPS
ncbi:MAG: NAD-binding protein [Proteobacteria bacterium]|nr:potassium transporter [Desulfobacula sp.]MBU3953401.1 NAD-binding protein [Pseudomonadota bacterium]MBU4129521.1 NAD-binding protein [Pseudomonadota bacterium]